MSIKHEQNWSINHEHKLSTETINQALGMHGLISNEYKAIGEGEKLIRIQ